MNSKEKLILVALLAVFLAGCSEQVQKQELPEATATPSQQSQYSTEELQQFIDCLDRAETVIYGAKWCGYCKKLVSMLGGYDIVAPIYIECPENEEICDKEGVTAYPTIKINGTKYTGARTFEGLAEATGCPVPE
jgi:glutaredoxin